MANPFYVSPGGDYSRGLSMLGGAIQQQVAKGEEEERVALLQKQQEEGRQAVTKAFQSGDPNQVASAMIQYPEMANSLSGAMKFKSDATRQNLIESTRGILSNPQNADQILTGRIKSVLEAGGDPTESILALQEYESDPVGFVKNAEMLYAGLDPEGSKIYQSGKAKPAEPMTEYQSEMVRQKDAEIDIRREENKLKVLQNRAKGAKDAVTLEKLQGEVEAQKQKIEQSKIEKQASASDAYQAGQDTIDLIDRIEEHPGFSSYVGAKGVSSGFGLLDEPVSGTEAASVAGMIETLQSKNFMNSIQQMKGMGALSDAEGKKVASAIESLNPSMKEEDFKKSLKVIKDITKRGMDKQSKKMNSEQKPKTINWSDM